ncbi:MAG: hypothetical protein LBQ95_02175 [Lachnospiraceae bacterium]|nr:hypothetical protein [Lachnospiraceae bacterium]
MKIAVITTQYLEELIRTTLAPYSGEHEIDLHIYEDFSGVTALYEGLEDFYDGFLISGAIPKAVIIKNLKHPRKPIVDFGTDISSYYELFLRLITEKQADLDSYYLDIMDLAAPAKPLTTYLCEASFRDFYEEIGHRLSGQTPSEIEETERDILKKHISLWKKTGKKLSITRLSSIAVKLTEAGIPFYFVYPGKDLISDAFLKTIAEAEKASLQSSLTSAIIIKSREGMVNDNECHKLLGKAIRRFTKTFTGDFEIRELAPDGYLIYTNHGMVEALTNHFTDCALQSYINESFKGPVSIGYGLAQTHTQAFANAKTAVAESAQKGGESFLLDSDNALIGPLNKRPLSLKAKALPKIQEISEKSGLSTMTINKIQTVIKTRNSTEISSAELALALQITGRSANRFLKQLVQNGYAHVAYEKQSVSRGRPERVYQISIPE